VFYVAATRARKNLYIHAPTTNRFYQLPKWYIKLNRSSTKKMLLNVS
jgi:ATP-dependent exoDNAse (exonuclease V) beta subunit